MELVSVKDFNKISLKGVEIFCEKNDGKTVSIKITDESGKFIVVKKESTYSDNILVFEKAPPRTEERWTLQGALNGVNLYQEFDEKMDAEDSFIAFGRPDSLEVKQVEVVVE